MKKVSSSVAFLLILFTLIALPSSAGGNGRQLYAFLQGASEVPGPGDPDGWGTAAISLNSGQGRVCFTLTVFGISPATGAHIHRGAAGVPGPIVVPLAPPTSGTVTDCVVGIDRALVKEIAQNPSAFYVNVHNADYPPGAVRGQLARKATVQLTDVD